MKKIKNIFSYIFSNGLSWFLFRIKYEFRRKTGYFFRGNERIIAHVKKNGCPECSFVTNLANKSFQGNKESLEAGIKALAGEIYCFSNQYLDYSDGEGKIDWHYNPVTKKKSPENIPWNSLPDFGEYGDIKLIWEASRFPQVYAFINAYAVTGDEKYARECLGQIVHWCKKNPFPGGVNYKCGQEISFRLLSWIIATDYFSDFVDDEFRKIVSENIYYSLLRIEMNIEYAVKSVRNNHSISEAAGLFIGGLIFPQLPDSERFIKNGIKYLKNELAYQVYEDGSYIQHSMIYQRLVLDILSFVMLVSQKKKIKLPAIVVDSHKKLLDFLLSFCQGDGRLPNYGTNDGTRLFPLFNSDYLDFRPSLNLASAVSYGKIIFDDSCELLSLLDLDISDKHVPEKRENFDVGGYYILRDDNVFVMTRCHSYRHRPGQADMLHLDIWHDGENIFSDTGSYSYNSNEPFAADFAETTGHNTILINNSSQMDRVLKFGFSNWIKSKLIDFTDNSFVGEHYGYKKKYGITHRREVSLFDKYIIIEDCFKGIKGPVNIKQSWNTAHHVEQIDSRTFKVANSIISSDCDARIESSYISEHYNNYKEGSRLIFENESDKDLRIKTRIDF